MRFYFGPNSLSLKSYDDDVEKADQLDLWKDRSAGMGYFPLGEPVFRHSLFNFLGQFIHSSRLVDLPADGLS